MLVQGLLLRGSSYFPPDFYTSAVLELLCALPWCGPILLCVGFLRAGRGCFSVCFVFGSGLTMIPESENCYLPSVLENGRPFTV